jgi:hypothetical protein
VSETLTVIYLTVLSSVLFLTKCLWGELGHFIAQDQSVEAHVSHNTPEKNNGH